ncbi:hypothetical protein [Ruegeria hyattellae]|uniref:hypothetical protein n=1 Tax=Ruegeria hyattellae TaxID=3233337 RepID=UPI00355B5205
MPRCLDDHGGDLLRDEGLAYGEKRKQAGTKTEIRQQPDLVHPCNSIAGYLPVTERAFNEVVQLLRETL